MSERNDNTSSTSYISGDRSELAPLYSNKQENKGLRAIATFFTIFSIVLTVILAVHIHYGNYQVVPHGGLVTDYKDCSDIGANLLKQGGNAVDGAVASTLCMGVVHPHLTGLGGGGFMVIYDQKQHRLRDCLDFRVLKSTSSSVGVPGVLAGLYQAHSSFGVLPWKQVVTAAAHIARSGFYVSDSLSYAKGIKGNVSELYNWLSSLKPGQFIASPFLADTLDIIASSGPDAFYNGSLTEQLTRSGILSAEDIAGYHVIRGTGVCTEHVYNGHKVVVPGKGSGGPLLFRTLDKLNMSDMSDMPVLTVGEALKGNTELSWPLHSGSVVVSIDRNDLYVSIVSGLGSVLGSQELLPGGFILNNAVDMGHLESNDRTETLAVPFVVVDDKYVCGRRLISGASDARDAVQVLYKLLSQKHILNSTLEMIIKSPRVRYTNSGPLIMVWEEHNYPLPKTEVDYIKEVLGAVLSAPLPYPSVNIIQKMNDDTIAYADERGEGESIVF